MSSCRFTALPAFGVVGALDFGLSNRYIVVSHCFYLYLPEDIRYGPFFHMLSYYLYLV